MSEVDFGVTAPKPEEASQTTAPTSNVPADSSKADQPMFLEYNGRKLSQEEVLNKLAHGDQFIDQLKTERETDRTAIEELKKRMDSSEGVKEVMDAMRQPKEPEATQKPQASTEEALIQRAIEAMEQRTTSAKAAEVSESNWKNVTEKLSSTYGETVNAKVAEVAAQHGMSAEQAKQLAQTSPSAFLALFPAVKSVAPTAADKAAVNTQAFKPADVSGTAAEFFSIRNNKGRVAAYHEALRKASQ